MASFMIDYEKCTKCRACVAECPARILEMSGPGGYPEPVAGADALCIACGHCVSVCPVEAFSLGWLKPGDCEPVREEIGISKEQARQFLKSRRSIRSFKKTKVEREKLRQLLEVASSAPSGRNMQPWHWLVIENPDEVHRLARMVVDWMLSIDRTDPAVTRNLWLPRAVESWNPNEDRICRGAPHLIIVHGDKNWLFAAEDGALALSYLELFAPALGLGACWGGYFYKAAASCRPLFESLNIPENHSVYGAIMVGYPRYKYHRLPVRKAPRVTWK